MFRRMLATFVVLLFCLTPAGCNGRDDPVLPTPEILPAITIVVRKFDTGNFDGERISQTLDAYVAPQIGARVSLEYIEAERYNQEINKSLATDSLPDIISIWRSYQGDMLLEGGKLLPLDALLWEHGGAIVSAVGEELLAVSAYNGNIYTIASLMDRASCLCFEYRKNIADANGLDMTSVKTIDDLTAVLTQLKQKSDGIVPISSYRISSWDPLLDSMGVLMDYGRGTQVVNLYNTEEYRDMCLTISRWRENELLLNEDYSLNSVNNFVRSPDFFGKVCNYHPGLSPVDSTDAGEPIECVILGEPFIHTDVDKRGCWGISARSKHPVESMKLLNLMYSDPYVVNLLIFGIEGAHYEVIDEDKGVIDFPAGITAASSGYAQFRGYQWGNQFIGYTWNGWPEDLWERILSFDKEAPRSSAYGFTYDPTPVEEQVFDCSEVVSEYASLLEKGVGDVDSLLNEFNSALNEAGIDQVIAEKQRQLDDWLSAGSM
ncbi:MAG: ABC transporter substrate-binding protein [Synergistaceae bacterium]|nr:ABC transporter substrate-binding protein [Synergistaceae bacterium]